MSLVHYDFALDTQVNIKKLELEGRVVSLWTGRRGNEYEVRFCCNGKYENIYFFGDELEAVK